MNEWILTGFDLFFFSSFSALYNYWNLLVPPRLLANASRESSCKYRPSQFMLSFSSILVPWILVFLVVSQCLQTPFYFKYIFQFLAGDLIYNKFVHHYHQENKLFLDRVNNSSLIIILTQYPRKSIPLFFNGVVIIWKSAVNLIFTFVVGASILSPPAFKIAFLFLWGICMVCLIIVF